MPARKSHRAVVRGLCGHDCDPHAQVRGVPLCLLSREVSAAERRVCARCYKFLRRHFFLDRVQPHLSCKLQASADCAAKLASFDLPKGCVWRGLCPHQLPRHYRPAVRPAKPTVCAASKPQAPVTCTSRVRRGQRRGCSVRAAEAAADATRAASLAASRAKRPRGSSEATRESPRLSKRPRAASCHAASPATAKKQAKRAGQPSSAASISGRNTGSPAAHAPTNKDGATAAPAQSERPLARSSSLEVLRAMHLSQSQGSVDEGAVGADMLLPPPYPVPNGSAAATPPMGTLIPGWAVGQSCTKGSAVPLLLAPAQRGVGDKDADKPKLRCVLFDVHCGFAGVDERDDEAVSTPPGVVYGVGVGTEWPLHELGRDDSDDDDGARSSRSVCSSQSPVPGALQDSLEARDADCDEWSNTQERKVLLTLFG